MLVNQLMPAAGVPTGMLVLAGVLKTFLGLSASVMTTIYVGAFEPNGVRRCNSVHMHVPLDHVAVAS